MDENSQMKQRWKHITIFGMLTVIICVLGVLRFSSTKKAHAAQTATQRLRPVAVVLAGRGSIVNALELSGTFRAYQEVDVHAKVAGYIRHIFVDVGDKVKQGQVLAVLEVPELNAQVMGAKAEMQSDQNAIQRAQSEVERAQSSHSDYHSAYTRLKQASSAEPGLIAEQELDDALAKDKTSEAEVVSAQAELAESQSQLAAAQANLERLNALQQYSQITAPFAGVVTKRYADTGALIQAGTSSDTQSLPVVRLAEWSRLRLLVPVPESAVPQVHLGATVTVRVPALARTFEGKVARFSDDLDQQTRTMDTEIDVENHDGTLVGGMYAETDFTLQRSNRTALTVPVQAITRNGTTSTVMVVNSQGVIEERDVTLGEEGSARVEIKAGLSPRDEVVVGNRSDLRAGEKVLPKTVSVAAANMEAGS
ncbi:MAG TPA: efflux RND transporter periplasmic adaptor subunit [Terriglobales bacterium]|nr:efflux RND transporter periplasmic adaptor subunit [Terriglobales bacterium]